MNPDFSECILNLNQPSIQTQRFVDHYRQKILNQFLVVIFRMKLAGVKQVTVVFHNLVATGFGCGQ